MLFAVDVGNTHTVLGVFKGNERLAFWRVRTERERTADEWAVLCDSLFQAKSLRMTKLAAMVVSCVVPPVTDALRELGKRHLELDPLFVGPGIKTGMPILYDNPREVGADRIANSVAAHRRWPQDLIIVDFGTATTFDVVSLVGEYLGGVITPGVRISLEALFQRASRLPRVDLGEKPTSVVGRDTQTAMHSGILYGYAGLVDRIVEAIDGERQVSSKVVATGGLAGVISPYTKSVSAVDEYLTLEGLRILHDLNG